MAVHGSSSDSSSDSEGRGDDDTITKVIAFIHVYVFIITQLSKPLWSQQIASGSDNRSCLDNENIINQ